MFREVLLSILGKSGQLPARALKACNRRAEGFVSDTANPAAVFESFTVLDSTQKDFGKQIAWQRPMLMTFAVTALIASHPR
jgi:hypothetical protein